MKKILSGFLAFVSIFTLAGCTQADLTKGLPDYSASESSKIFTIGMWVGVPNQFSYIDPNTQQVVGGDVLTEADFDEQYRYIKESGINLAGIPLGGGSNADCLKLLRAAQKQGLRQLVYDRNLRETLVNRNISDENAIEKIRTLSANYKDHPSFAGHSIEDEPTLAQLDVLEVAYRRYKAVFPDKMFYTNLFPVIAPSSVIGKDYEAYLKKSAAAIPETFISYDHYPLFGYEGNTSVIDNFLYNMELLQKNRNEGQEVWTFLQSGNSAGTRAPATYADIAFQAYSFLAFGGRGIQWFCYNEVPSERFTGMINSKGEREPIYYQVQKVNKEILAFDHIYLNFDWKGVLTVLGSDGAGRNSDFESLTTSLLSGHERILSAEAQQDTVIGAFKDGEGRDGFMLVNYSDPGKLKTSKIRIQFKDSGSALVVRNGESAAAELKNGVFETVLESGEGCFIIPVK